MKEIDLNENSQLVRGGGLVSAQAGDHVMMMSIEQGMYYDLNATAGLLWQALEQPCTLRQLCHLVQENYDVGESECRSSVLAFLQQLSDEGMLQISESSTPAA